MGRIQQADEELRSVIAQLTTRIMIQKMSDFEDVWIVANRVCDRYQLGKPQPLALAA